MEIWLPVICALAGAALVWLVFAAPARSRADRAEAGLEAEKKTHAVRLEEIEKARSEAESRFAALSAEALGKNSESFLRLVSERFQSHKVEADKDLKAREEAIATLVKPIREELKKVEDRARELEKSREGAYQKIHEQVKHLAEGQVRLHTETGRLVQALRQPGTRGRWGEYQLRNVLEMAGMTKHVDFVEQQTQQGDDGALRPDVILRLPGGKSIVIDAKTPLEAYLNAVEAEDEAKRAEHISAHVRHLRGHMRALASKEYWQALTNETPDFVVMFVPGEAFVSVAMERDPGLFEDAVANRVLIATPTTLIALVKAVAYGWQQEKLTENARDIAAAGRELYDRVKTFGSHMERVGRSLRQTVEHFNRSVGSLEGRVLPSARRLETLGAAPDGAELEAMEPVEAEPRILQAPELAGSVEDPDAEKEIA